MAYYRRGVVATAGNSVIPQGAKLHRDLKQEGLIVEHDQLAQDTPIVSYGYI